MRRIVVLAVVALALVGALALNGSDVLDRLGDDQAAAPSEQVTPTPSPTVADPSVPVPGTVLTARPQPRRCPSPPCVP